MIFSTYYPYYIHAVFVLYPVYNVLYICIVECDMTSLYIMKVKARCLCGGVTHMVNSD